jgi:hypothetical protein
MTQSPYHSVDMQVGAHQWMGREPRQAIFQVDRIRDLLALSMPHYATQRITDTKYSCFCQLHMPYPPG